MPQYDYKCRNCSAKFDVIKGIRAHSEDPSAVCPSCETINGRDDRIIGRPQAFIGTKVTDKEYNPGLGTVVHSKRHKEDLMKRKGVVEVGNDFGSGEKMQKEFDKKKQEERDKAWNSVEKGDYFL